jgi:hypothetical protein
MLNIRNTTPISASWRAHRIGNPGERVRPDCDTDDEVAEQRRELERAKNHHHQHRGGKQYQNGLQERMHK